MIEENTENRITSLEQEIFHLREQTILTHHFLEEIKEEVKKLNDENKYLHFNLALAINEIKCINKELENEETTNE